MNKVLKIIQIIALTLGIIEIVAYGIFISLYLANVLDLQTSVGVDVIGYISLAIVFFNIICLGIFIFLISMNKTKNDLKAYEIVGEVTSEAYLFADLGFIVIDDDNKIIWVSDLLTELNINIIGLDIYEWCNELSFFKDEKNSGKVKTIQISGRYYEIKYLEHNHIFLLKDVSEYENAYNLFQRNSLALGVIMIDNYAEIAQNNEDVNDIIPQIRSAITSYAKKYHLVLRSYKNDSYFVVGRYEDIEAIKKDDFSILNQVRVIGKKEDVNTSLSIGFAYDYSSTSQINEMASSALGIAMSRGGDQAVVAQLNKDLFFAGGKTQASENRNKVKTKSDANALINLIEENKGNKVYIMGHADADMDAIGSCLGMKAICDYVKCENAKIVFDYGLVEKKARSALLSMFTREEFEKMCISKEEALKECDNNSLLIICDVNNPKIMMEPSLIDKVEKVIIVDHHRRGADFIDNLLFGIIDTSASSASELITEIIDYGSKYPPIPLDSRSATIMLSGIFMDTNFYKTKTVSSRTFEASSLLKEYGADNFKANDLLKDVTEEYKLIASIVEGVYSPYDGIGVCVADDRTIIDKTALAKSANQVMELKNMRASFVIGRTSSDEVRISARSDATVNVQLICEKFGGGGHFAMSAAAFKNTSVKEVEKILLEEINKAIEDGSMLRIQEDNE